MKTDEDEAFDDIARRQGGGGYRAKRQAVMDKLQDGKCKLCVDGCIACDALAQPAQEPPKYAMRAYWEDDGRIGVVATVERPDGGFHLLGAIIDPPPAKEKAE